MLLTPSTRTDGREQDDISLATRTFSPLMRRRNLLAKLKEKILATGHNVGF